MLPEMMKTTAAVLTEINHPLQIEELTIPSCNNANNCGPIRVKERLCQQLACFMAFWY
jgi:hypothetical protein